MDAQEKLLSDSSFARALLYNVGTGDFELLPGEKVPNAEAAVFHARGLSYCGIIALVNGEPRVALDPPILDVNVVLAFAAQAAASASSH